MSLLETAEPFETHARDFAAVVGDSRRDGDELGDIHLRGAVNFTFGGPDGSTLFITADSSIWAATLAAKGA